MDEILELTPHDIIIIGMAPAQGQLMNFSQIQKLLFLLDENIGCYIDGPYFRFISGEHGPYDKNLDNILFNCISDGLMIAHPWNLQFYRLSKKGQNKGTKLLNKLPIDVSDYIIKANEFICSLSFPNLIEHIFQPPPHRQKGGDSTFESPPSRPVYKI